MLDIIEILPYFSKRSLGEMASSHVGLLHRSGTTQRLQFLEISLTELSKAPPTSLDSPTSKTTARSNPKEANIPSLSTSPPPPSRRQPSHYKRASGLVPRTRGDKSLAISPPDRTESTIPTPTSPTRKTTLTRPRTQSRTLTDPTMEVATRTSPSS
jgi:hypothetical protein